MSFLDKYLDHDKLDKISDKTKKILEEVEKTLDDSLVGDDNFSNLIKDHSDKIMSMIARIKDQFDDWSLSVGNLVSAYRFILDIAAEVSEIVDELSDKIVPPGTPPDAARRLKIQFGQDLTYFIYMLWNPRIIKWVPDWIETKVEKKIISKLAGMVMDWMLDIRGSASIGP